MQSQTAACGEEGDKDEEEGVRESGALGTSDSFSSSPGRGSAFGGFVS